MDRSKVLQQGPERQHQSQATAGARSRDAHDDGALRSRVLPENAFCIATAAWNPASFCDHIRVVARSARPGHCWPMGPCRRESSDEPPQPGILMASDDLTRHNDLLAAYAAAHYKVSGAPTPFVLRIGHRSAELASVHLANGVRCSAFLTGWNPHSVPQPENINRVAQERLQRALVAMGFTLLDGFGEDPSGAWPGEPSVLVLGISRSEAERVGRAFSQLAIVWSGESAVPELVALPRSG
jgi:hypothetical protein